jgi:hypothetical protein
MRDHRNLHAFQLADELDLVVYLDTKNFPKEPDGLIQRESNHLLITAPPMS